MFWPFSQDRNSKDVDDTDLSEKEELTNYVRGKKLFLEDSTAFFNTEQGSGKNGSDQERATFKNAWDSIKIEDFRFEKLLSIPCFRDAGMAGFSSLFVLGSIVFLYHKNPVKAANWGVGGFLLGSIISWEQCRFKRRRSFQTAQLAKNIVAAKEKPMINGHVNNDQVTKYWKRENAATADESQGSKAWYRFW